MKRILCIVLVLVAASVSLSAQQQGDKAVAAFAQLELATIPSANFDILAEFDYFVVDNVRASFALGLPVNSRTIGKVDDKNLKRNSVGVYFNPNVAYYFKLADNIYYTPEIGFGYELGSFRDKMASTVFANGRYNGIYAYLYPIYFEIQVNARMALGIALGELYFESYKYRDASSNYIVDTSKYFSFSLNSASLCWRYYL